MPILLMPITALATDQVGGRLTAAAISTQTPVTVKP
jgi:hypothetical protein